MESAAMLVISCLDTGCITGRSSAVDPSVCWEGLGVALRGDALGDGFDEYEPLGSSLLLEQEQTEVTSSLDSDRLECREDSQPGARNNCELSGPSR